MKILHNRGTLNHNPDSDIEGRYRTFHLAETVSDEALMAYSEISEQNSKSIHAVRLLQKIKGACKSKTRLAEANLSPESLVAIETSARLAVMAAATNSFAVTRPPGHHASSDRCEGFCFLNNVAIGVSTLLRAGGRVCIIDFDGHHGNGTQSIFRNCERVLFFSIHQGDVYPHSGFPEDLRHLGRGKCINLPLRAGAGDDVLIQSFEFARKYISDFRPSHIAVSAGFDGYYRDRLLGLNYTRYGFYHIGAAIARLGKPAFAVLEGGYHTDLIACLQAFVDGVNSCPAVLDAPTTSPENVLAEHQKTITKMGLLLKTHWVV